MFGQIEMRHNFIVTMRETVSIPNTCKKLIKRPSQRQRIILFTSICGYNIRISYIFDTIAT